MPNLFRHDVNKKSAGLPTKGAGREYGPESRSIPFVLIYTLLFVIIGVYEIAALSICFFFIKKKERHSGSDIKRQITTIPPLPPNR
jgi:hypothetical protein